MSNKNTHLIETSKQLKEIARPVRNEIRLALEMLKEATIADLGLHLGRSAESLYYHVRKLESVGLVVKCGEQIKYSQKESIYRLCNKRVRVNTEVRQKSFVQTLVNGTRTLLRYAERCLANGLKHDETILKGRVRECRLIQVTTRLSRSQVIEVNEKMLELEKFLEEASSNTEEKQFLVTIAFSPTSTVD